MFKKNKMKKVSAQIASEYVMTFFLIVVAVSAMSVYIERAIKGRLHDARDTMVDMVNSRKLITIGTPKQGVWKEYEPYYIESNSDVNSSTQSIMTLDGGGSTGIFKNKTSGQSRVQTNSVQLPPKDWNSP